MLSINYDTIYVKPIHHLNHVLLKLKMIGVIHRAHTAIDNFITDVEPILRIASNEKKQYIMGDYNIDLKDDSDRPTHDYLDFIYSYCVIPSD